MRVHIDWLSFSMRMRYDVVTGEISDLNEQYALAIEQTFLLQFGAELTAAAFGGEWTKNERSRAPYTDAWKLGDGNITLFASPSLSHCTVEISGKGCEKLITKALLHQVLQSVHSRVTRIDIAADIQTTTTPDEFIKILKHERMRSSGAQDSASGSTRYVGSMKSERFARVYRYNKPHPRAHLLRVEHEFRRDYAKKVAAEILASSLESVAVAAGEAFGWSHPVWDLKEDTNADISIVSAERNAGKTVFWLVNSVAPAFRKLVEDGTIKDAEEFIARYFLST